MREIAKDARTPLAIVGGGAAGAWLLILLRRALGKLPATIVIEPREQLGLGIAYSATLDVHRLNVTAEKMDIFPEPGVQEFATWLMENTAHGPTDYVPRSLYGRYLSEVLALEMEGQPLEHRRTSATRVMMDGGAYLIQLVGGETIHADNVILAYSHDVPLDVARSAFVGFARSAGILEKVDTLLPFPMIAAKAGRGGVPA